MEIGQNFYSDQFMNHAGHSCGLVFCLAYCMDIADSVKTAIDEAELLVLTCIHIFLTLNLWFDQKIILF